MEMKRDYFYVEKTRRIGIRVSNDEFVMEKTYGPDEFVYGTADGKMQDQMEKDFQYLENELDALTKKAHRDVQPNFTRLKTN